MAYPLFRPTGGLMSALAGMQGRGQVVPPVPRPPLPPNPYHPNRSLG